MPQKSIRPAVPAKNEQGEYATFEGALKKVLAVPRSEISAKLIAETRTRERRKKLISRRADRDKD